MKVSGNQIFWMITIMETGMTILMTLTPAIQAAGQDAWMSIILADSIALFIAWITTRLGLLYPEQSLIQTSQTILGKWPGKIIMLVYFLQWYTIMPVVLRQFTDVLQTQSLPWTPKIVIILVMVSLIIYATYSGGIESIGRTSEVLGPITLALVMLVLLASVNNIRWTNLLPVYADSGLPAIGKGALPPASYLGHAVEFAMLVALINDPRKGAKSAIWAVIVASIFTLLTILMIILTLGPNLTSTTWYDFFEMTKRISLFGFIENLDALVMTFWVAAVFIKLAVYFFITCYGTAQWLNVRNWKTIIWFAAPLVAILSLIPRNVTESTALYLNNYWVPVVLPVNMIGIPLMLLIIGTVRKKRQNRKPN
ncbi:GerAB/ArcD/ProY family transporter [Ferviditalea candida]|uniref:Endospore germination permease n=1 Tax=Ferviditalea candida TaxID=3108399 RepID=A0ABU5ZJ97_9BACL|nr:endospore germination permease [Paenibacillaceae bacterium T2]